MYILKKVQPDIQQNNSISVPDGVPATDFPRAEFPSMEAISLYQTNSPSISDKREKDILVFL